MADGGLIPGLDGDLPPDRGHLTDSIGLKKAPNGETVGYSTQGGPGSNATVAMPQVSLRRHGKV